MPGKRLSALCAVALVLAPATAPAATFNVTDPTEFQAALTTAQNNGENDVINVAAGTYNVNALGALTYTADAAESFSISILGADSTSVILEGGAQVPILRIDTTAVSSGSLVEIEVTNMTFQNGLASGTTVNGGALAIEVLEAMSVSVTGSEFYFNRADGDGGAIYVEGNFLEGLNLNDLTIQQNEALGTAVDRNGDGGGAAIRAAWPSRVFINDIDFIENEAAGFGGGLEVEGVDDATGTQHVSLYDVMFERNLLTGNESGGGASLFSLDVFIDLVGFVDNTATDVGGGLHLRDYSRNRTINSGFVNNTARLGGGFGTDDYSGAGVILENCTVTSNTATELGGGVYISRGLPNRQTWFYNNIVWGNTGPTGADIYINDDPNDAGGTQVTEVELVNNIYNDFTTKCRENVECTDRVIETDNLDVNPQITSDLHLLQGSPAIDAGLTNGHPAYPAVLVDYDGDTRPFDGDGDSVPTSDIGIDEYVGGVPQATDVAITMTDTPDPVLVNGEITYNVTVTNNGPGDVIGVIAGFAHGQTLLVDVVVSQGSFAAGFGLVQWTIGDIANGESVTATILIQHLEDTGSQTLVSSDAWIEAVAGDPNAANDQVTVETTVVLPEPDSADLAINMGGGRLGGAPIYTGGPDLGYFITIDNNGPDTATGITVTDTLPEGVVFVSATATAGECDSAPTNGEISCTIDDMANGSDATIEIIVNPDVVSEPTTITNTAVVASAVVDPLPANNTASLSLTVNPPSADMSVTTSSADTPMINEPVTYTVTVNNAGPSDNTGVVLTVTLPASATLDSLSIDQGTCETADDVVTCTVGDVAAGAGVSATIQLTAPGEAMVLTLSATIIANAADPVDNNNASSEDVTVIDVIDLVIRGTSEGTGNIGWLELLLIGAVCVAFFVSRRRLAASKQVIVVSVFAVAAIGLLMPGGSARAENDWYVGVSIGSLDLDYSAGDLQQDLANLGWSIDSPSVDDSGTAWKAYAGFEFGEHFALEGGYADLGKVVTQYGATIPPTEIDSILSDTFSIHPYQGDGWFAAGVVTWPINPQQLSLHARAGIFGWESDLDVRVLSGGSGSIADRESGTDMMYGVGLEWQLNDEWSLTMEWERYKLNEWLDVPSIGVRFYF